MKKEKQKVGEKVPFTTWTVIVSNGHGCEIFGFQNLISQSKRNFQAQQDFRSLQLNTFLFYEHSFVCSSVFIYSVIYCFDLDVQFNKGKKC